MRRPIPFALGLSALALLATQAPALAQQQQQQRPDPQGERLTAVATLQNTQGQPVGQVVFTQYPGGVVLTGELENLPPGWHGIHVHETGACTPDFKAAGGHYNPTGVGHGFNEGDGPHAGDLPNIHVHEDGTNRFEMMTQGFSLAGGRIAAAEATAASGTPPTLFDQDGSAVIIHAQPDDYVTDPAGSSGDRIACGVIQRPGQLPGR